MGGTEYSLCGNDSARHAHAPRNGEDPDPELVDRSRPLLLVASRSSKAWPHLNRFVGPPGQHAARNASRSSRPLFRFSSGFTSSGPLMDLCWLTSIFFFCGADDRTRTGDLRFTKPQYQVGLSSQEDKSSTENNPTFAMEISQELARKFLNISNVAAFACYANATHAVQPSQKRRKP